MGIEALYRRPRTTKPEPGHKVYPYLLRGMAITRPNQVWAMDITYIAMARGFVYLAVVLDWASRRVLSWRLSITMEAAFCVETLEDALARHGKPDIFNTDQGSQFTGAAFTGALASNGIAISMDGKGAWRDNVFIERLWRSVKYEEVYLRAYNSVSEARASLGRYLDFYNSRRPHSSLDGMTPDQAYFPSPLPLRLAALPWQSVHLSTRKICSDNRDHLSSFIEIINAANGDEFDKALQGLVQNKIVRKYYLGARCHGRLHLTTMRGFTTYEGLSVVFLPPCIKMRKR